MNFQSLKYVIEISKCASINKAAQNLFLSQPNLSSALKKLEQQLGFTIFERSSSGVKLTPAGELFIQSANRIMSEVDVIKDIPNQMAEHTNLSISCTYSYDFMNEFLHFKHLNPSESKEDYFKETGLIQTVQDIVDCNYRLSLLYCFESQKEKVLRISKRYDIECHRLISDIPVQLLVSKNDAQFSKGYADITEIQNLPCAIFENFEFSDWLEVLGFKNTDKTLFIFDRGGLVEAVRHGKYVSFAIASIGFEKIDSGCAMIPIRGVSDTLNIYLLKRENYRMNKRESAFIQHILNKLAPLGKVVKESEITFQK